MRFNDDQHLMLIIDRIVSQVGRRVDEASPMVDARLPDGSRINAIIPPLALDGPSLSIRRFGKQRYSRSTIWSTKDTLTAEMVEFLRRDRQGAPQHAGLRRHRLGQDHHAQLPVGASFPIDERIVTIEDSAELLLQQPHVVRLETRPSNVEGKGEVTQRELVK